MNETKLCPRCGTEKPLDQFYATSRRYCKQCKIALHTEYQKRTGRYNVAQKEAQRKAKARVMEAYGNKCVCCGETTPEFLSLDHIKRDGAEHRRIVGGSGAKMWYWLIRNNFPEGLRVLCFNCNMANAFSGYCPHERAREASRVSAATP